MLPFYVYILKCSDGSYYTGHTDDIEKRISEHRFGLTKGYTSTRLPIEVVFVQDFVTRDEALAAERKIKGWTRRKKEALIARDWDELIRLSNEKKAKIKHS
ncbi:GIY-YIG nuclease family protein [bacterium]|nr:MAG: GIY-YIG nuclease family protein [bacterium]